MTRLQASYRFVVTALAVVAGAILFAVTLAIPVDVTLRACCNKALFGLTDLTEHGLAAATFLGAPWVLTRNAHVAVDLVVMLLPTQVRRRLAVGVDLLGAAISALLSWYSFEALATAFARGSMVRGIIVIPEWWTLVAPTLCMLLLAIGFLLRLGTEEPARETPGL